jgi:UDP-N-acetylglucosamine transferase subunit ALG13
VGILDAFFPEGKIRGVNFLNKEGIVFVTVGTDPQPFDRLLKEVDSLAGKGFFSIPVFCQTGYSKYMPKNAEYKAFLDRTEFEQKIAKARLVITHGGAGSIGTALQHGKKCVAVARLARFGEHANDHQLELVDSLNASNRVIAISDEKQLRKAVKKSAHWQPAALEQGKKIIRLLEEFTKKTGTAEK